MARRPVGTDKVSGDDRLAVARFKRMQRAQTEGNTSSRDEKPQTQIAGRNQFGKRIARRRLLVGLETRRRNGRRRRHQRLGGNGSERGQNTLRLVRGPRGGGTW